MKKHTKSSPFSAPLAFYPVKALQGTLAKPQPIGCTLKKGLRESPPKEAFVSFSGFPDSLVTTAFAFVYQTGLTGYAVSSGSSSRVIASLVSAGTNSVQVSLVLPVVGSVLVGGGCLAHGSLSFNKRSLTHLSVNDKLNFSFSHNKNINLSHNTSSIPYSDRLHYHGIDLSAPSNLHRKTPHRNQASSLLQRRLGGVCNDSLVAMPVSFSRPDHHLPALVGKSSRGLEGFPF